MNAVEPYDHTEDTQREAMASQVAARSLEPAGRLARGSMYWKEIAIALGLLTSLAGTECFVTYCGFSNGCPLVEQIANWPLEMGSR